MKRLITFCGYVMMTMWSVAATAQIESTLYFMNSLPQNVTGNPAFVPKYKFALGLPGSTVGMTYTNNGFSYNDLVREENGKQIANLNKWSGILPQKTWITTSAQVDVFRLGLQINPKVYITLNSSVKAIYSLMIPKDLTALVANGTSPYIGQTLSVSPQMHMTSYWENSAGVSLSLMEHLRVGARIKMLKGIVNTKTEYSDLSITVADNYAITAAADMKIKTSGLNHFDDSEPADFLSNSGWGIDLGATYQIMPKLTVAASIVDVGRIHWKNDVYEYSLSKDKASYTFSGFELDKLISGDDGYIDAQLDSIENQFQPEEKVGGSYKSALPAKLYLSGEYQLLKNFTVGAVFFTEKFQQRISPGFSVGMNKNFGKILSTSLSYTMSNRSLNNLGAGISLNFTPIQIYMVGDNLLRLPISLASNGRLNEYINNTQVFNFRAGINLVWGWKKTPAKPILEDNSGSEKKSKKAKQDPAYLKVRKKK